MKLMLNNENFDDEVYFAKLSRFLPAQRKDNPLLRLFKFAKDSSQEKSSKENWLSKYSDKRIFDFAQKLLF